MQLLIRLIAAVVMLMLPGLQAAHAQGALRYPERPLRLVVPYPPGGTADLLARIVGQRLGDNWGRSIVIDNRGGAGGNIATEMVARSEQDGYTLLLCNAPVLAINPTLYKNVRFDPVRDFAPVSLIATGTLMLVVHPSVPGGNLAEFIAHAKSQPGKLAYASGGPASVQHLATELLKREAGISLVHVPYKGSGPGTIALLSGEVQAFITNVLALHPHVKAGKLKALAVASAKRNPLAPEVPTFAELGYPKVDVNLWQGVMGPARTPPAIADKLSRAIAEAIRTSDAVAKLATQGAEPAGTSPREFSEFIKNERSKWLALAQEAKIVVD